MSRHDYAIVLLCAARAELNNKEHLREKDRVALQIKIDAAIDWLRRSEAVRHAAAVVINESQQLETGLWASCEERMDALASALRDPVEEE